MIEPLTPTPNPFDKEKPATVMPKKRSGWLPVLVLAGVFLVGFVPMWLKSGGQDSELFRAQRQLRVDQIQITFANAALDARRGDYESARKGARILSALSAQNWTAASARRCHPDRRKL